MEPACESLVVLIGQDRSGHKYSHLFGVAGCLEGRTDSHLGLAESHIATDESVHRMSTLHIGLDVLSCLKLVGSVLIEEAGLKLVLHEGIRTKGKAFFIAPLGIELDEIARNVLDALLSALLHAVPCSGAENAQSWGLSGLVGAVLADFIERVDGNIHLVVVLIDDADDFFEPFVGGHAEQSAKFADSIIHMDDKVAGFHLLQFLHRQRHLAAAGAVTLEAVFVEAVEDLMIGEAADLQRVVDESLVDGFLHWSKFNRTLAPFAILQCHRLARLVHTVEDVAQSFLLPLAVGKNIDMVAFDEIAFDRLAQQVKILVIQGLGRDVEAQQGL